MDTELAMNALLMAVWRGKPTDPDMVHSDQGSQLTSKDWRDFLTARRLEPSMSRRENCHDNAVAENFLQLLKRERIKRSTYAIRDDARQDFFDYIKIIVLTIEFKEIVSIDKRTIEIIKKMSARHFFIWRNNFQTST